MPPIRMPPTKPMRTERTHEENQERAYIAASRRSDRSLEARVESARRASEIHKKRTGRSLRVREEDVMNEEMYEEEDDDLPLQYRRISALNPNFLNGRLNNYLMGQAGLRNLLHDAIYAANQNTQFQQNQYFNPMMDQNGMQQMQQPQMMNPNAFTGAMGGMPQSPFSMQNNMPNNMQNNTQGMRPNSHHRSASIATPQELATYNQNSSMDSRRMSVPAQGVSAGVPSPAASHPRSSTSSHPPTPHAVSQSPTQMPTPYSGSETPQSYRASLGMSAMPGYDPAIESQIYPLTTKVPLATQQLMGSNATHPSQLSPTLGTSSMGAYSYNPNGKPKRSSSTDVSAYFKNGLDQTLTSGDMQSSQSSFFKTEPESAVSAPAAYDHDFENMMSMGSDMKSFNDYSGGDMGDFNLGNDITPGSNGDADWGDTFFNLADASD